jgi:hypothetical protein
MDWVGLARFMVPAILIVALLTHLALFVSRRLKRRMDRLADEKRQDAPVLPPYASHGGHGEWLRDLLDPGVSINDIMERCRGKAPEKPKMPVPVTEPQPQHQGPLSNRRPPGFYVCLPCHGTGQIRYPSENPNIEVVLPCTGCGGKGCRPDAPVSDRTIFDT